MGNIAGVCCKPLTCPAGQTCVSSQSNCTWPSSVTGVCAKAGSPYGGVCCASGPASCPLGITCQAGPNCPTGKVKIPPACTRPNGNAGICCQPAPPCSTYGATCQPAAVCQGQAYPVGIGTCSSGATLGGVCCKGYPCTAPNSFCYVVQGGIAPTWLTLVLPTTPCRTLDGSKMGHCAVPKPPPPPGICGNGVLNIAMGEGCDVTAPGVNNLCPAQNNLFCHPGLCMCFLYNPDGPIIGGTICEPPVPNSYTLQGCRNKVKNDPQYANCLKTLAGAPPAHQQPNAFTVLATGGCTKKMCYCETVLVPQESELGNECPPRYKILVKEEGPVYSPGGPAKCGVAPPPPRCNNNVVDVGDDCDNSAPGGTDNCTLGGAICSEVGGACFCIPVNRCNNGIPEPGDDCDTVSNPCLVAGQTCNLNGNLCRCGVQVTSNDPCLANITDNTVGPCNDTVLV